MTWLHRRGLVLADTGIPAGLQGSGLRGLATLGKYIPSLAAAVILVSSLYATALASPLLPGQEFPVLSFGLFPVAADFDRDGRVDVVSVPGAGSGPGFFHKGMGDGTFDTLGELSWEIRGAGTAADLNRDGLPDLVLVFGSVCQGGGVILTATGRGDGAFDPPVYYWDVNADYVRPPLVGDFNGDGSEDIASFSACAPDLSVLFGKGDGTLKQDKRVAIGTAVSALATGDFDDDGRDDLAVATRPGNQILLWRGLNDEGFAPAGSMPGQATLLVAEDWDGDGRLDLLSADRAAPGIRLFKNDGNGTFSPPEFLPTGFPVEELKADDLDHDGLMDLIAAVWTNPFDRNLIVMHGRPDGSIEEIQAITTGEPATNISMADFNLDGFVDLVARSGLSGRISVLLADGPGRFHDAGVVPSGSKPAAVAAGDLNEDGRPDVVVANAASNDLSVMLAGAGGSLGAEARYATGPNPAAVTISDFSGDGHLDVVVSSLGPSGPTPQGRVEFFAGRGDGVLEAARMVLSSVAVRAAVAVDLNEDAWLDLVVAHSNGLYLVAGHGDGTFADRTLIAGVSGSVSSMDAGDLDGDGHADIALCDSTSVKAFLGDGAGHLVLASQSSAGLRPFAVVMRDFDSDGSHDLAVADFFFPRARLDAQMWFLAGRGDGSFEPGTVTYGVLANPEGIAAGDFDADGNLDVVIPDTGDSGVAIYLGRGDRSFASAVYFSTGEEPAGITTADFDGDSRLDIVVANRADGSLSLLLNQGPHPDEDADGLTNAIDECTDRDGDGFGDRGFAHNTCPADNCPFSYNPDQTDVDGDGLGDVCDPCPLDGLNDADADGICADEDGCPTHANERQTDRDVDGVPDTCDNCRRTANSDQADANRDGSGDACQPTVAITTIKEDGGDVLEVTLAIVDPEGDDLAGRVSLIESPRRVTIEDLFSTDIGCSSGWHPEKESGKGVAYFFLPPGFHRLTDLDLLLGEIGLICDDGQSDYWFAPVSCAEAGSSTGFDLGLNLTQAGPQNVCVRPFGSREGGFDLNIEELTSSHVKFTAARLDPTIISDFNPSHPQTVEISALDPGARYRLQVTVLDEETVPITAEREFLHQSESIMDFNLPPRAKAILPAEVECTETAGGPTVLDGTGSTDPNSSPGTHDDIAAFEWIEDIGTPMQSVLGTGETLAVTLPLGAHAVSLRVTDAAGESDVHTQTLTVQDTMPPSLICPEALPGVECTGAGASEVTLVAAAADLCSPAVEIQNDRTPNGADASGPYPLGTTPLAFTARDASGNEARCDTAVTVRDTAPPSLTLHAGPATLWPPNHEMVPVHIWWEASDVCDPAVEVALMSVTSSEPDDAAGMGDGATTNDVQGAEAGTADGTMDLRAERDGSGAGRTYQVTYRATDGSGNGVPAVAVVTVPHDQGQGPEPLLMRLEPDGSGPETRMRIYWPAVTGALAYDVIAGDLSALRVERGELSLGAVRVLAHGEAGTSMTEPAEEPIPAPGQAFIYLIQHRTDSGGTGYGTATAPWPRLPASCEGGCPP